MKRKTSTLACLLALSLAVWAPPTLAEKQAPKKGGDDCDCAALAAAVNGLEVQIYDLESELEGYNDQLSIPGKIATSLAGYDVRAVEGRCNEGEGRVGLEGGWKLCFPIGSSAQVIPFITDFLEQLGYDPKEFREAANLAAGIEDALQRAQKQLQQALADCAQCRCDCA